MHKPISRFVVILAMLVAFVGQAWASSAMSCEMMVSLHKTHVSKEHCSMTEHGSMEQNMSKTGDSKSDDCCNATGCVCPASGCTSAPMLFTSINIADVITTNAKAVVQYPQQPVSIISSLYRPPIFA